MVKLNYRNNILYFFPSYDNLIEIKSKDYCGWKCKGALLKKLKRNDEAIEWFIKNKFIFM